MIRNKKAKWNYKLIKVFEAGLVLLGAEVKGLRMGEASIEDSYIKIKKGEAWLLKTYIAPLNSDRFLQNYDAYRKRKLLLRKREIRELESKIKEDHLTIIPLKIYFNRGKAKIEIALVRGKKEYDKRQALRKKESQKEIKPYLNKKG